MVIELLQQEARERPFTCISDEPFHIDSPAAIMAEIGGTEPTIKLWLAGRVPASRPMRIKLCKVARLPISVLVPTHTPLDDFCDAIEKKIEAAERKTASASREIIIRQEG